MKNQLVQRLKKVFEVETDGELAQKLGIAKRQVKRWHKNGFHPSTEKILNKLLDLI